MYFMIIIIMYIKGFCDMNIEYTRKLGCGFSENIGCNVHLVILEVCWCHYQLPKIDLIAAGNQIYMYMQNVVGVCVSRLYM